MRFAALFGIVRHRRAVILGSVAAVVAAAWAYLLLRAGFNAAMAELRDGPIMTMPPHWNLSYAALAFVMWVAMMVAMMLPSAAPTVLLVSVLASHRLDNPKFVPAAAILFVLGYLFVWSGFSLAGTLLQWGLDKGGLLSTGMAFGNATLASSTLICAGLYQWMPLKDTCLTHCRSPMAFLVRQWDPGKLGAIRTGIRHGLFCVGCCWMLMMLMFVGGLMNLAWAGVIALLVLLEKTAPWGDRMSLLAGMLLVVSGAISLVRLI